MQCEEIITILLQYQERLIELFPGSDIQINIASQYSFIVADISKGDERYVHLKFEIGEGSGRLNDIYCEDRTLTEDLENKMDTVEWPGLTSTVLKAFPYPAKIKEQVEVADKIAALAVNFTDGDNYRPGNFSKVLLTEDYIELSQVNHMNAKSLAHKEDYSLRSLVFTIPFDGSMSVKFSDRSSQNNRVCGDKIEQWLRNFDISISGL
ncbi:MAG TPA: hypothetical protein VK508_12840 [Cyclobacteriaceae bacterium]|nr:hypothetical protein [Cyclobacteriaceae bacterium]